MRAIEALSRIKIRRDRSTWRELSARHGRKWKRVWFIPAVLFGSYRLSQENFPTKMRALLGDQIFGPKWSNVVQSGPNWSKRSQITRMAHSGPKSSLQTILNSLNNLLGPPDCVWVSIAIHWKGHHEASLYSGVLPSGPSRTLPYLLHRKMWQNSIGFKFPNANES